MKNALADSPQLAALPRLRSAARFDGTRQVPFHTHEAPELVFCAGGHLWIDVAGQTLEARPGTLFVLPGKVPHNQRAEGRWRTLCALFFRGEHVLDMQPRTLDLKDDPKFAGWLEDLCDLHAAQPKLADPVADTLLLAILTRAAQHEARVRAMQALHPRLAQALGFLQAHAAQDVSAEELSAAACISYSHLSAIFRERFGCGPLKYHQNLRMERAQKLLLNPYLSIGEVAEQVGFADTNYFVRLFRKSYALSPGRWRKETLAIQVFPQGV